MFPACEERIDKKYGKWGRVLGKGTGGTVRLIQGPPRLGGKVFAVKEFRKKKGKETDFEYRRMITTECCFANGLKHVNVIETVDIVRNKSRYFQVMEYAPYDLFSVVMSGRMVQPEIYCVFRQICDGVAYLHSTGLAHRDLKLENCVMTNGNVVKLIDFGTATPSYHPDKGVMLSSGLVGSDPYVAPEVIRGEMYDARRADVWSLGIIFLAMMLRRFPWALADPRKDLNYRKFASTLHELPRPHSPKKVAIAIPDATVPTPRPIKPRPQRSADEPADSSASSAYDVPAPSLFGPGDGSITTFATADSSLVLTPSDTGGSADAQDGAASGSASRSGNWVVPHMESYENWEEVIERLCAERSESGTDSSRSSFRTGMTSRSGGAQSLAPPTPAALLPPQNGLFPPVQQVRREASEPVLSTLARPAAALLPTRVPRPPISTQVSNPPHASASTAVLGQGLSTSPVSPAPPVEPSHAFALSSPTLVPSLPLAQLTALDAPPPKLPQRIIVSPDNTLSYLPAETRWVILRMLQIEPASRCSMADLLHPLPPTPPQSPPRSSAASTHEDDAHPHAQLGLGVPSLPSGLQMTPARRAATMPAVPRRRQEPGIEELGRDWLRGIVPCSDMADGSGQECATATHVHVRLKTSSKEAGSKWPWKKS